MNTYTNCLVLTLSLACLRSIRVFYTDSKIFRDPGNLCCYKCNWRAVDVPSVLLCFNSANLTLRLHAFVNVDVWNVIFVCVMRNADNLTFVFVLISRIDYWRVHRCWVIFIGRLVELVDKVGSIVAKRIRRLLSRVCCKNNRLAVRSIRRNDFWCRTSARFIFASLIAYLLCCLCRQYLSCRSLLAQTGSYLPFIKLLLISEITMF